MGGTSIPKITAKNAGLIEGKARPTVLEVQAEPIRGAVHALLERRIKEFHPDVSVTKQCVERLIFSDRRLSDREKLTVLAICRCYHKRQFTLLCYIGYLENKKSTTVDLPFMLNEFRQSPHKLLNVSTYNSPDMMELRQKLTNSKSLSTNNDEY